MSTGKLHSAQLDQVNKPLDYNNEQVLPLWTSRVVYELPDRRQAQAIALGFRPGLPSALVLRR